MGMSMQTTKISKYSDLVAWQKGHDLVLDVYRVSKDFPPEEKFCLVSQVRRAVISVTSNIAEGFGRNTRKDKQQFYAIAKGSLLEVENQLTIAKDFGYLREAKYFVLEQKIENVARLIAGLINSATDK